MRLAKILSAAVIAAGILGAGAASAAGVVNGSFETGGPGDAGLGGFSTLGGGSTSINGWTVTGDSVDWINGYWQGADGTHSVDLNGVGVGGVEQLISTTPGKTYKLSFSLSGNPDNGSDTKTMLVSAGQGVGSYSYAFTTPPNSRGSMNWVDDSLTFTASGPSTLISFQSTTTGNCCWGPALDNVSLSAVPEPTTWAMAVLGFGLMGVALRRRPALARARS